MSENFKHVIMTPYFVKFNRSTADRDAKLRTSPDWLENRIKLFEKFCFPSVMNQSVQDFVWLLYFDHETPADYLERIRCMISVRDNIKIVMCDIFDDKTKRESARDQIGEGVGWLLTTRLDNDDALHRDFVKNLHENISFERVEFLNYPVGILYYKQSTFLYRHESNAFVSFLEPAREFKTVWCGPHPFLNRVAPVRQLPPSIAFMQVVHGQTRSNKPRGVRIHRLLALQGFEALAEVQQEGAKESDADILRYNVTVVPVWAARDGAVKLARDLLRPVFKAAVQANVAPTWLRRAVGE